MDKHDDNQEQTVPATTPPTTASTLADPPTQVLLHMPVSVRSATLIVLAALAVLATLHMASEFFIPVMVAFMFSHALAPVVDALERWRIPRAISAAVLILGLLGGIGFSAYSFSDDANQLIASLPEAAQKVRGAVRARRGQPETPLETVQKAAAQLEQAAEEASPATAAKSNVQRVVIEKPRFDLREHLWNGTMGLVRLVGQVVVVTFLTYFLLLAGNTFRRKLVKITGTSLSDKKITVQALDEIASQIQR
jgi:predicted PurR-regulated permease PerM